jgi:RNA polymerase sigma-70 factor (ECF subfamily)
MQTNDEIPPQELPMVEKTLDSLPLADWQTGLVLAARRGDAEAFGQLAMDAERTLYRVSRTVLHNDQDCADAMQETLAKAWLRLETLREPRHFHTWLIRILLNECYRQLRRNKRKDTAMEPACRTEHGALGDDLIDLRDALAQLPHHHRVAIVLYHVEDLTVKEIARILRVPPGTVKSRLARARANLAACMGQKEEQQ